MKLTKEECVNALENFWDGNCNNYWVLKQLINEHFDNNLISENSQLRYDLKFMEINFREAIDHANEFLEKTIELEKENELLKRENKALADDNEMKCDEIKRLKKDLKLVCQLHDGLLEEKVRLERMLETFK